MNFDIAIDLGSCNTRIYLNGKGIVLDEPTVVAVDLDTENIVAVGMEAYNMIGRTADRISPICPIVKGVITDAPLAEAMLKTFIKKSIGSKLILQRVIVNIPEGLTDLEKHILVSLINKIGVRRICLFESCKAAVMGSGNDICSPIGRLVIDMGGGKTEIGVVSLGDISVSKAIKDGGNSIDEEIIKFIRKKYSLFIGNRTAENIKNSVCCACEPEEIKTLTVKGRNCVSGLPMAIEVSNQEFVPIISEYMEGVARLLQEVIDEAPPELLMDIYSEGILLVGGLSQMEGICEFLREKVQIDIFRAENPQRCVILGCGKAIKYIGKPSKDEIGNLNPIKQRY